MLNDVLEQIKALSDNINAIEDIWKIDNGEVLHKIIGIIIETNLQIATDPVIDMVSEVLSKTDESLDFKTLYTSILTTILNK